MKDTNYENWSALELLRADLYRHYALALGAKIPMASGLRFWLGMLSPRFIPVLLCRLAYALNRRRFRFFAKIVSLLNFVIFGIEISMSCPIGPGLFLPHTQGTVIGAWKIGANATIFQGVTLGAKGIDFTFTELSRPTLGDNVTIGSGAKVLGGLTLAEGVRVGANAVVISNLPSGVLAVGNPSRIISSGQDISR